MKNWKSFGNMKPGVVVVVPTWSMQVHNPINNVPEMKNIRPDSDSFCFSVTRILKLKQDYKIL